MTQLPTNYSGLETQRFETAWDIYLSLKDIYPAPKKHKKDCQIISSIYDIAESFDTFIFDGYGVLNIGLKAVPGMPEFIRSLQKKQKPLFVLTNGATYDQSFNLRKFKKLGYDFSAKQIISSRDVFCDCVSCGHIERKSYGVSAADLSHLERIPLDLTALADDSEAYDGCEHFILLSSGEWNMRRHNLMRDSLLQKKRPVTVLNPDVTAPVGDIFSCEPGYFGYLIYKETGVIPDYFGKPFQNAYDVIKKNIDAVSPINEEKTLMIGDTPQTDILGGNNAGFKTLLMADYGLFRDENFNHRVHECGIFPDYVLSNRQV